MAAAEIKASSDQKKLIWAIGLGVVALVALWWTFIGFGGSQKPKPRSSAIVPTASPSPAVARKEGTEKSENILTPDQLIPVVYPPTQLSMPEAQRNIFAYYIPPTPTPKPATAPSPTPTPPLLLASISPSRVYARTDDFLLEATGDKFTPAARIVIDGRELTTRYVGPQQVATTVPAAVIATPGQRQIVVRTSDGLYSNPTALLVDAPPTPSYSYIGIIGKTKHIGDTAILENKASREVVNVQRGDVLEGRFRVTSISERELIVVDTNLKIKHTLPLTVEADKGSGFPQRRPTPKPDSDDEP
jgi:hypothetical protein